MASFCCKNTTRKFRMQELAFPCRVNCVQVCDETTTHQFQLFHNFPLQPIDFPNILFHSSLNFLTDSASDGGKIMICAVVLFAIRDEEFEFVDEGGGGAVVEVFVVLLGEGDQ